MHFLKGLIDPFEDMYWLAIGSTYLHLFTYWQLTIYQNYISSSPSLVFRIWHGTSVWNSSKDFLGSRTLIQNKTSSNLQQKSKFFSFPIGISKFCISHFYLSKKILLPLRHFVKMACKKIAQGWFWPMILRRRVLGKTYLVCELTSPRRLFLQSNLFQETSALCNAEDFATC